MAYDELVTVRAYRKAFPIYALLRYEVTSFVFQVTADEGGHFRYLSSVASMENA